MPTPEFLVWAIEEPCPLRQIAGFENPERTERHLRTLRAYSDAAAERRIFEGICFEPAADPLKGNGKNGFRVADALSLYGGLKTAEESCCKCPANALKQTKSRNLAGCFGMVPLPAKETEVHSAVEAAIDRLGLRANVKASFSSTTPA